MMLLHGVVRGMRGLFMKNRGPRVVERGPVMMCVVPVRRLILIARMRVLW